MKVMKKTKLVKRKNIFIFCQCCEWNFCRGTSVAKN